MSFVKTGSTFVSKTFYKPSTFGKFDFKPGNFKLPDFKPGNFKLPDFKQGNFKLPDFKLPDFKQGRVPSFNPGSSDGFDGGQKPDAARAKVFARFEPLKGLGTKAIGVGDLKRAGVKGLSLRDLSDLGIRRIDAKDVRALGLKLTGKDIEDLLRPGKGKLVDVNFAQEQQVRLDPGVPANELPMTEEEAQQMLQMMREYERVAGMNARDFWGGILDGFGGLAQIRANLFGAERPNTGSNHYKTGAAIGMALAIGVPLARIPQALRVGSTALSAIGQFLGMVTQPRVDNR